MDDKKTVSIKGRMFDGTPRDFTFIPMDTVTTLEVFTDYDFTDLMLAACLLFDLTSEDKKAEDVERMSVVTIAQSFPLESADRSKFYKNMLGGATVSIPVAKYSKEGDKPKDCTIGPSGLVEYAPGDPSEQVLALAYAFCANYPKYTDFFIEALADNTEKDSTQGDTQKQDSDDKPK